MPPDRAFIQSALADIENAVRFLRTLSSRPERDFVQNLECCYSACYALIMAIEGVSAISSHLIAACGYPSPGTMSDAFEELCRQGVIADRDLCRALPAMARFRNLLVHQYWKIDHTKVYRFLTEHLGDFARFAAEIQEFLVRQTP